MKPHPPGAVASLVFGILALVAGLVPVLGICFGLAAITWSRRAQNSLRALPDAYQIDGLPTAGLVTGIIGMALSAIATMWSMLIVGLISALVAAATGHPVSAPPAESVLLW